MKNPDQYALPEEYAGLPAGEFAFPGELRDRLVAAILDGSKTTTSGLFLELEVDGEELARPGDRKVVVDSDGRPVAVIETTDIRVLSLAEVDLRHALDEGEGFDGVEQWRRDHEDYWHSAQYGEAIGQPGFTTDDATLVIAQRFRLVRDLHRS